jgi:hypothetical protein
MKLHKSLVDSRNFMIKIFKMNYKKTENDISIFLDEIRENSEKY